ncbi:MAG TPA: tRNA (adenosine(37)-N6)-dimethylallyltransferase MiaA [Candidatus Limnocylindrales bacterium]|nr:tRNA (adenosine(37)-N6)-dimethylallyltransferase MiaA [Candidatus Limnocylindrales bacterium]
MTTTNERPPFVLALFGPTAGGKSGVAEALAERVPAEIVSADAMQAYRGLPILTNQPDRPTRLVGVWPLEHEGSVGAYQALAHAAVDEVLAAGATPVVAGGTGLYLRAALADLAVPPAPTSGARARFESLYQRLGPEQAHKALAERDPAAAAAVHPRDRRRVVRALELAEAGASLRPSPYRLWGDDARHPAILFGLDVPRELLAKRIELRARAMFEGGVEEEVAAALRQPLSATAQKIMGLREVAELPRAEALQALIARTRRYAAYQRKWMRRLPGLVSLRADRPAGEIADEILEVARHRQRLPADRAG